MSAGSLPATGMPTERPSGVSPRFSATLASITTQADEPSESWLALPAVIVWPSPITGFRLASPSRVVSGRLHSSLFATTSFSLHSLVSFSITHLVALHAPISLAHLPAVYPAALRC